LLQEKKEFFLDIYINFEQLTRKQETTNDSTLEGLKGWFQILLGFDSFGINAFFPFKAPGLLVG